MNRNKSQWLFLLIALLFHASAGVARAASDRAALARVADKAVQYWMPAVGEDTPDWARRIEFELRFQDLLSPTFSFLTVQPLYQDEDKVNTVFAQGSHFRYELYQDFRNTTNFGIGYRRLLMEDTLLVGLNVFLDKEWTNDHLRTSVGAELKWGMLDWYANRYVGLTSQRTIRAGVFEDALDGYDTELRAQVPYLPWMRMGAKAYSWDTKNSPDVQGWEASIDADVTRNLLLEAGAISDTSRTDAQAFVKLTFSLPRPGRAVMASSDLIDSKPFKMRDMKAYTLDKVRRQNKIITERVNNGVVITRGN